MANNTNLLSEELKHYYRDLLDAVEQISEIAKELAPRGVLERLRRKYKDSWHAATEFLKGAGAVLSKTNAAINAFQQLRQNPTLENCEKAYYAFLDLAYSVFPLYPRLKGFELAPTETPPTIDILKRKAPFDRIPEFLDYEIFVSYAEVEAYTQRIHQDALHIATIISILCFETHSRQALAEGLKKLEFETQESLEASHETEEEEYEHGF